MEEKDPGCTIVLQYFKPCYLRFKNIWLFYLDLIVKTRNEEKEQYIFAEIIRNHCVQYDFLYFTPSVDGKETQAKRVFENALHLPKLWLSLSKKWHDECSEKQNDQDLPEELRNNRELLFSIEEKVINDKMNVLAY